MRDASRTGTRPEHPVEAPAPGAAGRRKRSASCATPSERGTNGPSRFGDLSAELAGVHAAPVLPRNRGRNAPPSINATPSTRTNRSDRFGDLSGERTGVHAASVLNRDRGRNVSPSLRAASRARGRSAPIGPAICPGSGPAFAPPPFRLAIVDETFRPACALPRARVDEALRLDRRSARGADQRSRRLGSDSRSWTKRSAQPARCRARSVQALRSARRSAQQWTRVFGRLRSDSRSWTKRSAHRRAASRARGRSVRIGAPFCSSGGGLLAASVLRRGKWTKRSVQRGAASADQGSPPLRAPRPGWSESAVTTRGAGSCALTRSRAERPAHREPPGRGAVGWPGSHGAGRDAHSEARRRPSCVALTRSSS